MDSLHTVYFVCLGMFINVMDWGAFQDKKINGMDLRAGNIAEENLTQCAFQQTMGDEFTFQQDNNLKYKAKSTIELLTKTTVDVPEWLAYISLKIL